MSYLVIARKYRPLRFEDVIGQEHVTRTLTNAINMNKVHHAYIFTGPRGVGKTTISRILAKALNCETGITATPCGTCNNCREIDNGGSMDVREIDGASNRGIDEIRNLRDEIKFAPSSCRKKIYIIDEVHMLTNQAFNALLKTLEEPPAHALFIFATTEINEVPATILSRCQRHDFKRVSIEILTKALAEICQKEGVEIDAESLLMIARSGDGSVRDSQSVLDQVIAYSGLQISADKTAEALGIPGQEKYFEFFNLAGQKDQKELLYFIEQLIQNGLHIHSFLKGLLEFVRNLLILQSTKESQLISLTADNIQKLGIYCGRYSDNDLLFFMDLLSNGVARMKNSAFQRIDFEILLLKIFNYTKSIAIEELINKLNALENNNEPDFESLADEVYERLKKKIVLPEISQPSVIRIVQQTAEVIEVEKEPLQSSESTIVLPPVNENIVSEPVIEIVKPVQENNSQPEKTTVETGESSQLSYKQLIADWANLISFFASKIPSLGNMLDYGVPVSFSDKVLTIKFANRHSSFKNLAEYKLKNISEYFNAFYKKSGLIIKLIEDHVSDEERIIKVREEQFMSEDELKNQLLKEAPQLEFLFNKPLSCKIIK